MEKQEWTIYLPLCQLEQTSNVVTLSDLTGHRTGPTQSELYKHRRWLEAANFRFRKNKNCTSEGRDVFPCDFRAKTDFFGLNDCLCVMIMKNDGVLF